MASTIQPVTKGNRKLGEGVVTESRITGPTCPSSCPLLKSTCYSKKTDTYHPGIAKGWTARLRTWRRDRKGWMKQRARDWSKAAAQGKPLRLLVHGDLLVPGKGRRGIDWPWVRDIASTAARAGIKGWGYTHAWRLARRARELFAAARITLWASVHNPKEAKEAAALGFRVAYVLPPGVTAEMVGKSVPDIGTGRPAVVCPFQVGTKSSCDDCRFCEHAEGPDLVFLHH